MVVIGFITSARALFSSWRGGEETLVKSEVKVICSGFQVWSNSDAYLELIKSNILKYTEKKWTVSVLYRSNGFKNYNDSQSAKLRISVCYVADLLSYIIFSLEKST